MRHRKRHTKMSMRRSQRKATLKNMVAALILHEKITTIKARAKEIRRMAEKLITVSKSDTVAARRRAYMILADRDLVGKLFKTIAPLFKNRTSGYTRIIPLGFRKGDGAEMAILELTEKSIVEKLPKAKEKKAAEKKGAHGAAVKETKGEVADQQTKAVKEHKEEPKAKTLPKSKPTLEEEKRVEKARSEDKKAAEQRGFMKNLRGLFRKRGDR